MERGNFLDNERDLRFKIPPVQPAPVRSLYLGMPSGCGGKGREFTCSCLHQCEAQSPRGITEIAFNLPKKAEVELTVYNAAGMRVKTLVNGKVEAGIHKVTWEGTDARGTTVPQGVHFFKLGSEGINLSKKCILMK